jgi:hypothetical protein
MDIEPRLMTILNRPHEALRFKIGQASPEIGLAFASTDLVSVDQFPAKPVEILGLSEKPPDVSGNRIEPEAMATRDIEGDQIVTKVGFEQFLGPGISNDHGRGHRLDWPADKRPLSSEPHQSSLDGRLDST